MLRFIPNILTLGRFVLTIIFLVMVLCLSSVDEEGKTRFLDIAFILFLIAGVTDILDGKLARKLNVTSKFGRMMDPLADKVLVCGSFICFAIIGEPKLFTLSGPTLSMIHWFTAAVIILREVFVTIIRHRAEARGVNFAATKAGKMKMLLQSITIGTIVVKMAHVPEAAWGNWFTAIVLTATVIVTIYSGLNYAQRKRKEPVEQ